jgi:hypothetical protein
MTHYGRGSVAKEMLKHLQKGQLRLYRYLEVVAHGGLGPELPLVEVRSGGLVRINDRKNEEG